MQSWTFIFFGTIVVLHAVNGVISLPMSLTKKQTPYNKTTLRDKTVVFNCNVNQDSHVSDAIKGVRRGEDGPPHRTGQRNFNSRACYTNR